MTTSASKRVADAAGVDALCTTVDLSAYYNWPGPAPQPLDEADAEWWRRLGERTNGVPRGRERSWGIPFALGEGDGPRTILITKDTGPVEIAVRGKATYLDLVQAWDQRPSETRRELPREGLAVGEYVLAYDDGTQQVQPIRARFEVGLAESPGPAWLCVGFTMYTTIDPAKPTAETAWGIAQNGVYKAHTLPQPMVGHYALPNPHPEKTIRSLTIRVFHASPLIVAGLTLFRGTSHPLRHLPRRMYRVATPDGAPAQIEEAKVDLGSVARIERTTGACGDAWLAAPFYGVWGKRPDDGAEDLLELYGAEDATVRVKLKGKDEALAFRLGDAFRAGSSTSGGARLEVLGRDRQWMEVRVIDGSTAKPTPVRLHLAGPRGEYIAPYGHHEQINANWFEDYGADVRVGTRSYAYVLGEFTTDLPVGDLYVEMIKGFEYEPVRQKVTIRPGQKTLELAINRWKDWRAAGWVTADTHVHFISPQTAWLEAQAEGVNVVNLLASQWGRLFTNVGDYSGRVGVVQDDTIVYVGTENRNHMLGHMSMLGTKGMPVYPMCCGGPTESWVADPDFRALAEWALENRRKGGVVIRPHFPYCGFTEDPVSILMGLVDALEIGGHTGKDFATQEWYRYLNCGYRVAVVGGTDKMGAYAPLGWLRTYARLDPNHPFTYDAWGDAVRAGRTISTTGPLMDLVVDGKSIGDSISLPASGGTLEVLATAESWQPLGRIELVVNGQVVAAADAPKDGARRLEVRQKVTVSRSGWIAARAMGLAGSPGYVTAHTSPVYVTCGTDRPFDGPAMEHMLGLVEGGIEYIDTLATNFDEDSRRRMVKLFDEARRELRGRLLVEGGHSHAEGPYLLREP